jgi:hypothetical protein
MAGTRLGVYFIGITTSAFQPPLYIVILSSFGMAEGDGMTSGNNVTIK